MHFIFSCQTTKLYSIYTSKYTHIFFFFLYSTLSLHLSRYNYPHKFIPTLLSILTLYSSLCLSHWLISHLLSIVLSFYLPLCVHLFLCLINFHLFYFCLHINYAVSIPLRQTKAIGFNNFLHLPWRVQLLLLINFHLFCYYLLFSIQSPLALFWLSIMLYLSWLRRQKW